MSNAVFTLLKALIPTPKVELDHDGAWQLLIATILSAQSTDARVNLVTPALFARFPTPADLGDADPDEVEALVRTTGFYRNKARAIRETSATLVREHGGEVPRDMTSLLRLRGVARKTANLVLGTALGVASGVVVDTHVKRVSTRLAFTVASRPEQVERDLTALIPQDDWVAAGHRLLLFGRYVCTAKTPACGSCPLNEHCSASLAPPDGTVDARLIQAGSLLPATHTTPEAGQ